MDNPGIEHWNSLLHELAYLRDHPYAQITYQIPNNRYFEIDGYYYPMLPNTLYCFVDADFASTDIDTHRSVNGNIIYFNGGSVSWKSGLQRKVSSNTTEAEYRALHDACTECIWLRHILNELGYTHQGPAIVFEDNSSTIRVSDNPVSTSKLRHIDTIHHQTREFIADGKIMILKIKTENQLADIMTKPLKSTIFSYLIQGILLFIQYYFN
jgi:hypothetical protein